MSGEDKFLMEIRLLDLRMHKAELYYALVPPVRFHFLQEGEGEAVGGVEGSGRVSGCKADRDDDALAGEALDSWLGRVEVQLSIFEQGGEDVLLAAMRSLEDVCCLCYAGMLDMTLVKLFNPAVRAGKELCSDNVKEFACYAGKADNGEEIHPVHVLVAICPQFGKLEAACKKCAQGKPCNNNLGWKVFTADKFHEFAKFFKKEFHAADCSTVEGVTQA